LKRKLWAYSILIIIIIGIFSAYFVYTTDKQQTDLFCKSPLEAINGKCQCPTDTVKIEDSAGNILCETISNPPKDECELYPDLPHCSRDGEKVTLPFPEPPRP
jgi:hypothetical protein